MLSLSRKLVAAKETKCVSSSTNSRLKRLDYSTMVKAMEGLDPSVKLLTLCNVQSAKPTKRQRATQRDWHQIAKKHKAAATSQSTAAAAPAPEQSEADVTATLAAAAESDDEEEETVAAAAKRDSYDLHWAQDSPLVEGKSADELKEVQWTKSRKNVPGLGQATNWEAQGVAKEDGQSANIVSSAVGWQRLQSIQKANFDLPPVQRSPHAEAQAAHGRFLLR